MVKLVMGTKREEGKQSASELCENTKHSITEPQEPRITKTLKQKMISKLKKNRPCIQLGKKELQKKFLQFIATKQKSIDASSSDSEFICPICLEMYMTPCPTSCGHIFCYRCIDESIVRNNSCPTCRTFIRHEQFIESKPFSRICHYFWLTSKERNIYLQKYQMNQKWMQSRRIQPEQIKIEDQIDVRDTEHIWCKAKVVDIFYSERKTQLLVHFQGWNDIYNQVINVNSQRLAPFGFFSNREDIPTYRLSSPQDNIRSRIDYRQPRDEIPGREINLTGRQLIILMNNARNSRRNEFRGNRIEQQRRRLPQTQSISESFLQQSQDQGQNSASNSNSGSGSGSGSGSSSGLSSHSSLGSEFDQSNSQQMQNEGEQEEERQIEEQQSNPFENSISQYLDLSSHQQSRNIQQINQIDENSSSSQSASYPGTNYLRQLLGRANTHSEQDDEAQQYQPEQNNQEQEQGISSYLVQNWHNGDSDMQNQHNPENNQPVNNRIGEQESSNNQNQILHMLSPDHNPTFNEPQPDKNGEIELKQQKNIIQTKNNPEQRSKPACQQQIIQQNATNTHLNLGTKLN